jgi:hypothetical protein
MTGKETHLPEWKWVTRREELVREAAKPESRPGIRPLLKHGFEVFCTA